MRSLGCYAAVAEIGGVYIAASPMWLWAVEGARPERWDLVGAVIVFGPRGPA